MVVIDTSVAYKWFSKEDEEFFSQAISLLKAHLRKKEIITAPDIIVYELANAWSTKTKLLVNQIKIFVEDLQDINIKIEPVSFELITKAIDFSKNYQVSVYDASYALLAQENKCDLFTADSKFVEQVNLPFIKHLNDYPLDAS